MSACLPACPSCYHLSSRAYLEAGRVLCPTPSMAPELQRVLLPHNGWAAGLAACLALATCFVQGTLGRASKASLRKLPCCIPMTRGAQWEQRIRTECSDWLNTRAAQVPYYLIYCHARVSEIEGLGRDREGPVSPHWPLTLSHPNLSHRVAVGE